MATDASEAKDPYPGILSEGIRLRAQHSLAKAALGNLILCPLDLSRPNLKILDSGTGDGYFLLDILSQLENPDSACLIGTDIVSFPDIGLPQNVTLSKQDILDEWPVEWEGKFDLVHQRATMVNAGSFEEAAKVMKRLVRLLKPGGWIQVVDGAVPVAAIEEEDVASLKLFKTMGNFLDSIGKYTQAGRELCRLMEGTDGLKGIEHKEGVSLLGKGAPSQELEKMGYVQIEGLWSIMASILEKKSGKNGMMSVTEFERLKPALLEEANMGGVRMSWYASWGQRV
jgi:SAM-dependent methyltransferase